MDAAVASSAQSVVGSNPNLSRLTVGLDVEDGIVLFGTRHTKVAGPPDGCCFSLSSRVRSE